MKKILTLLILSFSINAYAVTVDNLVNQSGKQAVMEAIEIEEQERDRQKNIEELTQAVDKMERDRQKSTEELTQELNLKWQVQTDIRIKAENEERERLKIQEEENQRAKAENEERERQIKIAADIEANYFTFGGYTKPISKALVSYMLWALVVLGLLSFLIKIKAILIRQVPVVWWGLLSFLIKIKAILIRQVPVVKAWFLANTHYLKKIAPWILVFGVNLLIFGIGNADAVIVSSICAAMYYGIRAVFIALSRYIDESARKNLLEQERLILERKRLILEAKSNKIKLDKELNAIIQAHARTLKAEHLKTIYQDVYGNIIYDRWDDAINYFIDNVLMKNNALVQALQYSVDAEKEESLAYSREFNKEISKETRANIVDFYYNTIIITRDQLHSMVFDTVDPDRKDGVKITKLDLKGKLMETQDVIKPQSVTTAVTVLWLSLTVLLVQMLVDFSSPYVTAFALTAFLIDKISEGRNWARITYLVMFMIGTLLALPLMLGGFSRAPVDGALFVVNSGLQACAMFLLFRQPGSGWFRKVPVA